MSSSGDSSDEATGFLRGGRSKQPLDDADLWDMAMDAVGGHSEGSPAEAAADAPTATEGVGVEQKASRDVDPTSPNARLHAQSGPEAMRPPPMPESSVLQHNLSLCLRGGGVDSLQAVLDLVDLSSLGVDGWRAVQNALSRHYRRCLGDVARTAAFGRAALNAVEQGVDSVVFIGVGSFVPALRAARAIGGRASTIVLEPSRKLRQVCEVVAKANGLGGELRVQATDRDQPLTSPGAYAALGDGSYAAICEAVGEGLATERLCAVLAAAKSALDDRAAGRRLLVLEPSSAQLLVAPLQLRTESIEGFDLSPLNALRRTAPTSGASGQRGPGWVPVRLDRQPLASVSCLAPAQVAWDLAFAPGSAWQGQLPEEADVVWEVAKSGLCCGFASWFRLRIGSEDLSSAPQLAEAKAEVAPTPTLHGWKQAVHYLGEELPVGPGTRLQAVVRPGPEPQQLHVVLVRVAGAPGYPQQVPQTLAALAGRLSLGAALPVQAYHFTMMADERRNRAFCDAISGVVAHLGSRLGRPARVLDLGCGCGLLGLAAARAGAHVWAVEMSPVLCAAAAECAERNSQHLTAGSFVVLPPAVSTQLLVGRDLPHRVDLVVSEILDSELVTEGVLESLRHAKSELLTPEGVLLPASASVFIAPVECFPLQSASSEFDLSSLEAFCSADSYQPIRFETMPHRFLGPPSEAFSFDFHNIPALRPSDRAASRKLVDLRCETAGVVTGLAWWFEVRLADLEGASLSIASGPGSGQRTWKQNCRFLPRHLRVQPGERLRVACEHTAGAIHLELSGAGECSAD